MKIINKIKLTHSLILVIAFFLSCLWLYQSLVNTHNDYWGDKGQSPQGLIYAVQTVEANIAAASLPYTIAKIIKAGKFDQLPDFLKISFGLTGFAVTTCDEGSNSDTCLNETLIGVTESWFVKKDDIPRYIENADFNILTDNHAPGIDWSYQAPKIDNIIDHAFNPEGEVIGRLYYLRWDRPSFKTRMWEWVTMDYFSSKSGEKKHFGVLLYAALMFFFINLAVFFITNLFIKTAKIREERKDLENLYSEALTEQRELKSDKKQFSSELELLLQEAKVKTKEIKNLTQHNNDLEAVVEADARDIEEVNVTKKQLEKVQDELDVINNKLKNTENKLEEKIKDEANLVIEIEDFKKKNDSNGKKNTQEQKLFQYFLDGVNTRNNHRISFLDQVVSEDIIGIVKHGISIDRVIKVVQRLVKTDLKNNDVRTTYEILKSGKFRIYHNKKNSVRIYFTLEKDEVNLVGIWSSDDAPHENRDQKMSELNRRLEKIAI